MDPISIASIVAQTTGTCLSTIKRLYDLREKYKDAPMVIVAICSESTIISASLAQIQSLLLQRQDLAEVWRSRTELPMVLDQALTGCMVIFSCLESEIARITGGTSDAGRIRWRPRLRLMWSESQLNDLLSSIRGQQTAMTLLIQLLQMNTLTDIRNMLQEQGDTVRASATMTRSLRARNPSVRVANSIYDRADRAPSSAFDCDSASVVAPSELEFEFDDMIINSQAYRRVMAQAKAKVAASNPGEESALGDLIDLTDNLTIKEGNTAPTSTVPTALRELQGLAIHGPPSRRQTADGYADQHSEPAAAVADVKSLMPAGAEPKEMPTTTSPEGGHSRSTTPTELVRTEPEFKGPGRCTKCAWTVTGMFCRVPTQDGDKIFHVECFTCRDCAKPIHDKFFPVDDIFLCETDYFRRLDLLCDACGKALRAAYITASDRKFHLDHFKCEWSGCGFVFGEHDSYYEHCGKHYCKYHYVQDYAERCASCGCPITEQFTEVESPSGIEKSHPECYMIKKFWNVQMRPLATSRVKHIEGQGWLDQLGLPIEPGELVRVFDSIKDDIHRVWTISVEFEEATATNISGIGEALAGADDHLKFIREARALLKRTAALFDAVQHVAQLDEYRREARLLCRKIVSTYPLAQEFFSRRGNASTLPKVEPGAQVSQVITGLAHYTKLLLRIGLRASIRAHVAGGSNVQLDKFFQPLENRGPPTKLVQDLDAQLDKPLSVGEATEAGQCVGCGKPVDDRCYSSLTPQGHRLWHPKCVRCEACGGELVPYNENPGDKPTGEAGARSMQCHLCGVAPADGAFVWLTTLDVYSVLLYVALAQFVAALRW